MVEYFPNIRDLKRRGDGVSKIAYFKRGDGGKTKLAWRSYWMFPKIRFKIYTPLIDTEKVAKNIYAVKRVR